MSSFKKKGKKEFVNVNKKRIESRIIKCPDKVDFSKLNISICIHCANLDIFKKQINNIKNFELFNWNRLQFIVNVVVDFVNKDELYSLIENNFNKGHFIIIKSKNKGLDIGGFLRCLEYVKDDDHIIVKIHTKGRVIWRNDMMKIFTKDGIYNSVMALQYKNIGMIGNNNQLWDFYKNVNMSYRPYINRLCNMMNLRYDEMNLHNGYLIGGTIFMCKKNILNDVIKHRNNLYQICNETDNYYQNPDAFKFELTMERFFGYIVYHYNKNIIGLIS